VNSSLRSQKVQQGFQATPRLCFLPAQSTLATIRDKTKRYELPAYILHGQFANHFA
jgi:hypothetical protein